MNSEGMSILGFIAVIIGLVWVGFMYVIFKYNHGWELLMDNPWLLLFCLFIIGATIYDFCKKSPPSSNGRISHS